MSRIQHSFDRLRSKNETAFVAFVMAGDPDFDTTLDLIQSLPSAGVDILEIGMPFSDPMADGPVIEAAGNRALDGGMTLDKLLLMIQRFRTQNDQTPIILMGYYNPIYAMGVDLFLKRAREVGVDGLIIVDLPAEEDAELCLPAHAHGIDFIRLATPTTDDTRLVKLAQNTSGFVYYVSITGITGAASADPRAIAPEIARVQKATNLPVCVGFGINSPKQAKEMGQIADGVVVGSAIVKMIAENKPKAEILEFVKGLSQAAKS